MSFAINAAAAVFFGAMAYSPAVFAQAGGGEELPSNAKSSPTAPSGTKAESMSKDSSAQKSGSMEKGGSMEKSGSSDKAGGSKQ